MPEEIVPVTPISHSLPPTIQWVPLGTLTVYHITEQALDQLEKGTPDSPYFGFAVFAFSTGVSFLIALLTTDHQSTRLYCTFLVVALVGIIAGLVLGLVWWLSQRSTRSIAGIIRRRKPPEGQQQT